MVKRQVDIFCFSTTVKQNKSTEIFRICELGSLEFKFKKYVGLNDYTIDLIEMVWNIA